MALRRSGPEPDDKPEGHSREVLVALRKLGKREVAGILAAKAEELRRKVRGKVGGRGKQR
jgi:hypothetical protein